MTMEIQSLEITKTDWFPAYRDRCTSHEMLQKHWKPAIGDWMERHYRLDLSPVLLKEDRVIEMICYKSTAQGYWHVTNADGKSTLLNSEEEIVKCTAKWIPRLDQLIMPFQHHDVERVFGKGIHLMGTIDEVHHYALEQYLHRLDFLLTQPS